MMKRSPGGAPKRPPSPLPGIRTREPVSTPAGIRTLTFSALAKVPLPLQSEQGGRRLPVPPQSVHSCVKRRRPPDFCTCPEPLLVGSVDSDAGGEPFDRFFEGKRERHFNVRALLRLRPRRFAFSLSAAE